MKKTIKFLVLTLIFGFFIFPTMNVQAQETVNTPSLEQTDVESVVDESTDEETIIEPVEISDDVLLDENIVAEDLGVNEQKLLPTSPYYLIKTIWRGFRSILTFDPVKKVELKLRYANERLIEAKQVAEEKDKPEVVVKALERYKKDLENISKIVEKSSEEIKANAEHFAEKMIDYSFKQQKLIDRIEKRLTLEQFEKVNVVREDSLDYLSHVIANLVPPEEIKDKIINIIEAQTGSGFKDFKNIEILKIIEEKVPEEAKQAIQQARENTIQRLQDKMINMVEMDRKKFKKYIESVGGNEIRHLEILDDFAYKQIPEFLHQEMEIAKAKSMERIKNKMQEFETEEQKKEFLHHLERGEMEDIRILKELENNLAPEMIEMVLETKNNALDNFRQAFEKIEKPQEQQEFLKKMEKLHDVRQLEIFKEIEQVIPQEKKEFFEQIKTRVIKEMEKELNQALNESERSIVLDRLVGDMPEHIEIIKEFSLSPRLMEEILTKQVKKIKYRIENVENAKDLYLLEKRINEDRFIREEFERRAPEIFTNIKEKIDEFRGETKKDEAVQMLEKAKHELNRTQEYFEVFKENEEIMSYLQQTQITVHFENAKKHIDEAEMALNKEEYGHVFGAATATLHELGNMSRIFKNSELRSNVASQRLEEMKELIQPREQINETLSEEAMEIKEDEILKKLEIYLRETNYSDEEINRIRKIKDNLPREIQIKLVNIPLEVLVKTIETLDLRSREVQIIPLPVFESREDDRTNLSSEASEYCLKKGGKLERQTNNRGEQVGICFLPDGIKCEQWDFLKGNCPRLNNQEEGQTTSTRTDEGCRPICKHIGSQSEGWYDSCTGELMKSSKCGPTAPISIPDSSSPGIACPLWAPPAPDWCKDGQKISGGEDQNGCKLPPKCVRALEQLYILPPTTDSACIQVITHAISGDICKAFPTPCDVPSGWQKVDRCPEILETGTRIIERTITEPIRLEDRKLLEGTFAPEGSLGQPSLLEKVKELFQ